MPFSGRAQSLQPMLADQARLMLETGALAATVQFDGRDATVWASSPVASNSTTPGRAAHRRVTIAMTQES